MHHGQEVEFEELKAIQIVWSLGHNKNQAWENVWATQQKSGQELGPLLNTVGSYCRVLIKGMTLVDLQFQGHCGKWTGGA